MTRISVLKSVVLVLTIAIALGIGGRFLPGPSSINAARLFKYKVVSIGPANTVYEYEKLLNDMAFQGWEFDHTIFEKGWVVFRK